MSTTLPSPLQQYFMARNRHDIDAMLALFAETATVRDEGRVHAGRAAIRAWMEDTTGKYRPTAEVTGLTADGTTVRVAALVSGTFPGSPAALHFVFTVDGDRIERLEIGA
jgi:hypothetical protein